MPGKHSEIENSVELRRQLGLLTPQELASALDVSVDAVTSWRAENSGPAWTRLGRRIYYRQSDIDQWAQANLLRPKAGAEPGDT